MAEPQLTTAPADRPTFWVGVFFGCLDQLSWAIGLGLWSVNDHSEIGRQALSRLTWSVA